MQEPGLETLMAAVIRLMARAQLSGDGAERRCVQRLLECLLQHPALEGVPGARAAIRSAAELFAAAPRGSAAAEEITRH